MRSSLCRKPDLYLLGVLLLAAAIRLAGITRTDVWADEATTLMFARASWWDLLVHLPTSTDHPPLSFLLFKAWSMLLDTEWGMRLLPVLFGVAAVGVLMRIARRIYPGAAIPTGLMAALSPVPVHYSQELRGYSLLFLLTALSLWAVLYLRDSPASRRRLMLLSLFAALAAHTHPVGLFVFPMCAVFLMVIGGRPGWQVLVRPCSVWLWFLLVCPVIGFSLRSSEAHRDGWWWIPQVSVYQLRRHLEEFFGFTVIEQWQTTVYPRPWWRGFVWERLVILCPAVLLLGVTLDQRIRRPAFALGLAAASFVGLMVLASVLLQPNLLVRTLLPAWAPMILLLGLGGASVWGHRHRALPLTAVGMLSCVYGLGWFWYGAKGPPRRPPARQAYQWIREQLGPHDVVVSAWGMPELTAYYLGDVVPCERHLGDTIPLFSGSPPVRKTIWATRDDDWPDRLRAALADAAAASDGEYSVWYVAFGATEGPRPGNIPEILVEHHQSAREFLREDTAGVVVAFYKPISLATQPVP